MVAACDSGVVKRPKTVSADAVVAASIDDVYAAVSDVTQMGRWSPENRGAVMGSGGGALAVGDIFVGRNKRGWYRWSTRCVIRAVEPNARLAFQVVAIGFGRNPRLPVSMSSWEYRFEPVDGGTRVTETWTDDRDGWPEAIVPAFDRLATRGQTFAEFNHRNIETTLRGLQTELSADRFS